MEAAIAYWHTNKTDHIEKWKNILQLYTQLLLIEYSPIIALNRIYALSKANGKEKAIIEAEKLKLEDNHIYFTLIGHLYIGIDIKIVKANFQKALSLAKTLADKQIIQAKIEKL